MRFGYQKMVTGSDGGGGGGRKGCRGREEVKAKDG